MLAVVLGDVHGRLMHRQHRKALPRLRLKGQHPLRLYAFLEVGIALGMDLLVLAGMPLLDRDLHDAVAEHGMPGLTLRAPW